MQDQNDSNYTFIYMIECVYDTRSLFCVFEKLIVCCNCNTQPYL